MSARALLSALLFGLLATATALAAPNLDARGCATRYDQGADYFPDKSEPEFATNFTVAYFGHYKIVTVERPYPGGRPEKYVLVQCGTPAPDLGAEFSHAPVISIPVKSLFSGSTSQAPALVSIDGVGALSGVAQENLIATPQVVEHLQTSDVVEYAASGVTNIEAVVAARPDVFMAGGGGEADVQRLAAAGIPIVNFADWLDTSPLGRAEWVKFMGLFFNAEAKANQSFDDVAGKYESAKALVADVPDSDKPLVLSGQAFGGVFFAAGGRSFIAQLIADAGGRYVFADDDSTGSFEIHDPERLMVRAREAKIWIQAAMTYRTLTDIAAEDPRLAALPAAQAGQVWIPDALQGPSGGVQFYELGSMQPDMVLMDLISILHPNKTPGYARVFNRAISLD